MTYPDLQKFMEFDGDAMSTWYKQESCIDVVKQ